MFNGRELAGELLGVAVATARRVAGCSVVRANQKEREKRAPFVEQERAQLVHRIACRREYRLSLYRAKDSAERVPVVGGGAGRRRRGGLGPALRKAVRRTAAADFRAAGGACRGTHAAVAVRARFPRGKRRRCGNAARRNTRGQQRELDSAHRHDDAAPILIEQRVHCCEPRDEAF